MRKYSIMTAEIEEIDRQILLLQNKRQRIVAREAKKKADELCAEMRKKKEQA